jgi:hypothetical protein
MDQVTAADAQSGSRLQLQLKVTGKVVKHFFDFFLEGAWAAKPPLVFFEWARAGVDFFLPSCLP